MNFNDLYKKMAELDTPTKEVAQPVEAVIAEDAVDPVVQLRRDLGLDLFTESKIDECGDMPMLSGMDMGAPKQQDNVSMNVSINGSGAGGIKDLINILQGIEDGADDSEIVSISGGDVDDLENAFDEEFANSPDTQTAPVDAVLATGNDLHGQGAEAPKVNGGGNPMQEALMTQLTRLYTEIKEAAPIDAARGGKPEYRDFANDPAKPGANEIGYQTNIKGNPDIIAAQKAGIEVIKALDPTADMSKFSVDGSYGPRTQGMMQYASHLLEKNYSNPAAKELYDKFWKAWRRADQAQGFRESRKH